MNISDFKLALLIKFKFALCLQIEDGEIFATINQKDGMVRFHDNPEQYKSAAMLQQLDKEVSYTDVYMYGYIFIVYKMTYFSEVSFPGHCQKDIQQKIVLKCYVFVVLSEDNVSQKLKFKSLTVLRI